MSQFSIDLSSPIARGLGLGLQAQGLQQQAQRDQFQRQRLTLMDALAEEDRQRALADEQEARGLMGQMGREAGLGLDLSRVPASFGAGVMDDFRRTQQAKFQQDRTTRLDQLSEAERKRQQDEDMAERMAVQREFMGLGLSTSEVDDGTEFLGMSGPAARAALQRRIAERDRVRVRGNELKQRQAAIQSLQDDIAKWEAFRVKALAKFGHRATSQMGIDDQFQQQIDQRKAMLGQLMAEANLSPGQLMDVMQGPSPSQMGAMYGELTPAQELAQRKAAEAAADDDPRVVVALALFKSAQRKVDKLDENALDSERDKALAELETAAARFEATRDEARARLGGGGSPAPARPSWVKTDSAAQQSQMADALVEQVPGFGEVTGKQFEESGAAQAMRLRLKAEYGGDLSKATPEEISAELIRQYQKIMGAKKSTEDAAKAKAAEDARMKQSSREAEARASSQAKLSPDERALREAMGG